MPARAGELDHGIAGDAFQNAGVERRRLQHAAADEEDVVARAFGDFALVIEHQGFDAAGLQAFDLGQNVVQIIQRFDPRVERGRMVANRAGGDDFQAVAVEIFRIELDLVGDDDHLRIAAAIGIEAQRARRRA